MLYQIKNAQDVFLSALPNLNYEGKFEALNDFISMLRPVIEEAESIYSREEIIPQLTDIRQILRDGPLFRLSQDWSKGYQGDFEVIRYILSNRN